MGGQPNFVLVITLLVLCVSLYKVWEGFSSEIQLVRSKVDGKNYLVRNLSDKERAADMLAELRKKLKHFVADIVSKKSNDVRVERLKVRFRPDNMSESTSDSKFTSYSVNKGHQIVFCIRERDENNKLVDMNTITFVALHELAHIMTVSIGHTKEFWDNFRFLLEFAIDNKWYQYQPYHQQPKKYCGTFIMDTPLRGSRSPTEE